MAIQEIKESIGTSDKGTLHHYPLCVDLDGTLIKTDILAESLIDLFKKKVLSAFLIPLWLLRGRAHLKRQIALRTQLDVTSLPYHSDFLDYIRGEKNSGRHLYLITASDITVAMQVADHLKIFEGVFGSDGKTNLKGIVKLQYLRERLKAEKFVYAGNSSADLPIWKESAQAIVVNGTKRLVGRLNKLSIETREFNDRKNAFSVIHRALRIHQWSKNLLIFVPLVLAHKVLDLKILFASMLAFLSFSVCASAQYLFNDLLDLEADRLHSLKKNRPFASGDLPIFIGILGIPVALLASIGIAWILPRNFLWILLVYFLMSLLYSLRLKKYIVMDFIVLAGLYTLRLFAGSAAYLVVITPWLIGFSMFFFTSLACVKRFAEIRQLRLDNKASVKGRGYIACDMEQISILGSASGFLSVLVFALYINGKEVQELYRRPFFLWFICPVLMYWISRVWILANRGHLTEDPILFALKDKESYLMALGITAIIILSV